MSETIKQLRVVMPSLYRAALKARETAAVMSNHYGPDNLTVRNELAHEIMFVALGDLVAAVVELDARLSHLETDGK